MTKRLSTLLLCLLLPGTAVYAQSGTAGTGITGSVYDSGTGSPIDFATVGVMPAGLYTVTDARGAFSFSKVDAGSMRLTVQYIGMETIDTLINVLPGRVNHFEFRMKATNFRMEEVTVTAIQSKAGQSTASTITRQAMDHLQATSLLDVMQLLPGNKISNPNLGVPNYLNLRSISGSVDNSLGTALIVDGAQQSNNANLQVMGTALAGSTLSANTFDNNAANSAAGVDTRLLSLDNIDYIEVIRGVPSAEYGDLTSGAVIVRTRAGKHPLTVKFKTNPSQYQGSVSKGLSLGEKGGNLNVSADYLYQLKKPVESYVNYQRLAASGLWSKRWNEDFNTNTSLTLTYGKDTRKSNPDNVARKLREAGEEIGVSFNHNGVYNINRGWFKSLEYGISGRYTDKHSWEEQTLNDAMGLYTTSTVDGTIITNWPGRDIYDKDGNKITNILPGNDNSVAKYTPNSYFSRWDIYGKEINANARLKAVFYKAWSDNSNRIVVGADYKLDGNRGLGKTWSDSTPIQPPSGARAYRKRPYYDIPLLHQYSLYLEDKYQHSFGPRELIISAGVRYDNINGKNALTPRVNAALDIFPEVFTLRAGYGIAAKAPSLLYLYPEKAYFDLGLFNGYVTGDPNQSLAVAKTHVYSTDNPDLEIARNRKMELGFDMIINKRFRFSVTAFDELMKNGYGFSRNLENNKWVSYPRYRIADNNAGDIPTLEPIPVDPNDPSTYDHTFLTFHSPGNPLYNHRRGVEFELDLGRFDAIRTSFYLDGAWMRETSRNNSYSYTSGRISADAVISHMGVYDKGRVSSERERMITTLRITHNIPRIGFAVTLTSQLTLMNKSWSVYGSDDLVKYISWRDGQVYDFNQSMLDDPEFGYLRENIAINRGWVEENIPTLFFNINVTKEIGNFLTASFFANNMFNSRPQYWSTAQVQRTRIELGQEIFFGFDLKITIR